MILSTIKKVLGRQSAGAQETSSELDKLLQGPAVLDILTPPAPPQFYALVDIESNELCGITPSIPTDPAIAAVALEYDTAIKFLTGEENVSLWTAIAHHDTYRLICKADLAQEKYERVDTLTLVELTESDVAYPDVRIVIGDRPDAVLIHFNGDTIARWADPIKLYFTAESNPHYLKCGFSLDVNIIDEIQRINGLPEWPNPIVLPLDNADDISVFTIKSNTRTAITRVRSPDTIRESSK